MEIDVGATADNPGTLPSVPGTGPTYAVTAMFRSKSKGKGKMYQEVVPAYLGTAPAYLGTALLVPGTSQPMEVDYMSVEVMEIDQTVFTAREVPSWARPIMDFMVNGQVPADKAEAHRIQRRSKAYTIINNEMYKRSATGVLQRCVESAKGQEMLREIIRGSVVTMLHPRPWCQCHFDMDFTGRRRCKKQRIWSGSAMDVIGMPTRFISQHQH
jgi:hypothetical protein